MDLSIISPGYSPDRCCHITVGWDGITEVHVLKLIDIHRLKYTNMRQDEINEKKKTVFISMAAHLLYFGGGAFF